MSICNQQALYRQVKESENSQLMSKLLVAYTKNLANGCIVNASQTHKIGNKTVKSYGTYPQKVTESDIKMKLKAGQSIEQILKPYIPEYHQFSCLTKSYHRLKKIPETQESTLHKIRLNIERTKLMKPG